MSGDRMVGKMEDDVLLLKGKEELLVSYPTNL